MNGKKMKSGGTKGDVNYATHNICLEECKLRPG